MSNVPFISPPCITEVEDKIYFIRIFTQAPDLVNRRELRNKYETNRDINLFSVWFLLKRISPESSKIRCWREQKEMILSFIHLNEKSFYAYLNNLINKGLVSVDKQQNIVMVSYAKAAEIMGLTSAETYTVPYNPMQHVQKKTFQYILRAEEIKNNQDKQLDTIRKKLDKNPSDKSYLINQLSAVGYDKQKLYKDICYFRECLLKQQLQSFKQGSENLSQIFTYRADNNRSVKTIAAHHNYKSPSSVTYMKKRMVKLGVISIEKKRVESAARSRLYIPDGNRERDGYKWNSVTKKTVLFLTDQIKLLYETKPEKLAAKRAANAA